MCTQYTCSRTYTRLQMTVVFQFLFPCPLSLCMFTVLCASLCIYACCGSVCICALRVSVCRWHWNSVAVGNRCSQKARYYTSGLPCDVTVSRTLHWCQLVGEAGEGEISFPAPLSLNRSFSLPDTLTHVPTQSLTVCLPHNLPLEMICSVSITLTLPRSHLFLTFTLLLVIDICVTQRFNSCPKCLLL